MAERLPDLRRGRIVWAEVRDRNGIKKRRPVIILTATAEIHEDAEMIAVAVTTTFPDPPPQDHVQLPWHPDGRTLTKLRKRSAAVLSWVVEVKVNDIIECHGDVPVRLLSEILTRIDELDE